MSTMPDASRPVQSSAGDVAAAHAALLLHVLTGLDAAAPGGRVLVIELLAGLMTAFSRALAHAYQRIPAQDAALLVAFRERTLEALGALAAAERIGAPLASPAITADVAQRVLLAFVGAQLRAIAADPHPGSTARYPYSLSLSMIRGLALDSAAGLAEEASDPGLVVLARSHTWDEHTSAEATAAALLDHFPSDGPREERAEQSRAMLAAATDPTFVRRFLAHAEEAALAMLAVRAGARAAAAEQRAAEELHEEAAPVHEEEEARARAVFAGMLRDSLADSIEADPEAWGAPVKVRRGVALNGSAYAAAVRGLSAEEATRAAAMAITARAVVLARTQAKDAAAAPSAPEEQKGRKARRAAS